MKKIISAVLMAALMIGSCPVAFAASDIKNHWAEQYITYLSQLEVMKPSSTGEYKPNQAVSRAEFMRYINRAFDFSEKATISFSDVSAKDSAGAATWYYEPIQIAVAHGYINGVGNNKMDPFSAVTREQAATIIERLHKTTPAGNASALTFKDKSKINAWSADYIAAAVKAGYLVGYPDGNFKPQGTITRAEFAKMLYNCMGTSLNEQGASYTESSLQTDTKNVTISAGVTLANTNVKGDLYITEGVMNEGVTLTNVTVAGKIIVSGGVVTMDGVNAPKLVVSTPLELSPQITATGQTNIASTEVQTDCSLMERGLDVSAGGFSDMTTDGDQAPTVMLDAELWNVVANSAATISTTSSTSISSLTAKAKVNVTGTGFLQKAILNVSGCSLAMEPGTLELASGVTASIAGEDTASANSVTISPSTLTFDVTNKDSLDSYTDFKMSESSAKVTKLTVGEKTLIESSDYRLTTDGFRLYQKFLATLSEGSHTLVISFEDGGKGSLPISVSNSGKNYIDITSATFDKFHDSLGYTNVTATLQLASGVTLSSIKLGGVVLDRGTDYTFNGTTGIVILQRTMLEKKSTGSYTITFTVSAGNNPTLTLNVEDSSPKNELTPTSVDFDANKVSAEFRDVTVELNSVDGAILRNITCGNKTLDENWQYRISGKKVILNGSAVADLVSQGTKYSDFMFNMSKGDSPVLRVNYVTTYPVKFTVKDDLGKLIEGVEVTLAPAGESALDGGTPAQSVVTNSEGIATFYVKNGTYLYTAKHEKFEKPVSKQLSVGGSRTETIVAPILESVSIYVTNQLGANLEGATVAVGNQSVTTGKNGLASFNIARGTYTMRVACDGYKTANQPITVNQAVTERITLATS